MADSPSTKPGVAVPSSIARSDIHDVTRALLASGVFSDFIGRKEDLHFEAKGAKPYDLDLPSGRFELAKDVSAFANAEGGHLVVGLEHERLPAEQIEQVKGLELIPQTAFNVGQIVGVVRSHVFPIIEGLEVLWWPSKEDGSVGLGAIWVPPPPEDRKYFLITKVFEEGEPQKEILVGVARRIDADNMPLTAKEIHRLIRSALDPVLQRSARIEEKLNSVLERQAAAPPVTRADYSKVLRERIDNLLGE